MLGIPGGRIPEREDGIGGTRQRTSSNSLGFVENSVSNLAVFGLVSFILFKAGLLGEMLALSLGLAVFSGDCRVCNGRVQVKL